MKNTQRIFCFFLFAIGNIGLQAQTTNPCGKVDKRCEQKRYINCYDKVKYDEEQNLYFQAKNMHAVFDDTCQSCYRNGLVMEQISVKQGKRNGTDASYYYSGFVQGVQTYSMGIENGVFYACFDSLDQIHKQIGYKMGQQNGKEIEFNRFGDTLFYANYTNGVLDGEKREYYSDGQFYKSAPYKAGLLDGVYYTLNREKQLEVSIGYKKGNKHGKATYYHTNGKIAQTEFWDNGMKNGLFQLFTENEKLVMTGAYKNNLPINDHIEYNDKEKIIYQASYDKKGVKYFEMKIDEYGEKKILLDKSPNSSDSNGKKEGDDDPEDLVKEKKTKKDKKSKKKKDTLN